MEKWANFTIRQKSVNGGSRCRKAYFACVLIGVLTKFLVDPYYEPPLQFMMQEVKMEIYLNKYSTYIIDTQLSIRGKLQCEIYLMV